jgi:hypothetical protein
MRSIRDIQLENSLLRNAQLEALVCSELADLHSGFPGKWNVIAATKAATSRLCGVRGGAQVSLAEGALTLPRLQAQQCGTGGGL